MRRGVKKLGKAAKVGYQKFKGEVVLGFEPRLPEC